MDIERLLINICHVITEVLCLALYHRLSQLGNEVDHVVFEVTHSLTRDEALTEPWVCLLREVVLLELSGRLGIFFDNELLELQQEDTFEDEGEPGGEPLL